MNQYQHPLMLQYRETASYCLSEEEDEGYMNGCLIRYRCRVSHVVQVVLFRWPCQVVVKILHRPSIVPRAVNKSCRAFQAPNLDLLQSLHHSLSLSSPRRPSVLCSFRVWLAVVELVRDSAKVLRMAAIYLEYPLNHCSYRSHPLSSPQYAKRL